MEIGRSSPGRQTDPLEWLWYVDSSSERNHKLMVTSLYGADVGDLRVLVICRAESNLKSCVRLEPLVKPIAVAEVHERRGPKVMSGVSHWNRRSSADDEVVVVIVDVLSKREHGCKHAAEYNSIGVSHAGSLGSLKHRLNTAAVLFSSTYRW